MANSSKESIQLPISLALAEKWAEEINRKTQRILGDSLPKGTRIPLLLITHGAYKILVREQGSCVMALVQVKISDDVRRKLNELAPEAKQRLLIALRGELSSNGRTAFSFVPASGNIGQLEIVQIHQLLKISEDDVSSFNRFCDALQEVVTTAARTLWVFGLFMSTQESSTAAVRPPLDRIYG